jgi:hypothetical protein
LNRRQRLRYRLPSRLILAVSVLWFTGRQAHAGDDYQLGHGLDVGPFNLAGYSELEATVPKDGRTSLLLNDLSLFVTGHIGRLFNPFTEVELTDFAFLHARSLGEERGAGDLVLERLYNDSYLTESVTLRLGKMLAPVGEWNEIHAVPLVLTTVRPAVTYRNFSEYATGVSILYANPNGNLPNLELYWQPSGEFSERPSRITFHQYRSVEGARITFPFGLLDKAGFSFQRSTDVLGVNQSLLGVDFHDTLGKFTLQGEGTVSDISDNGVLHARDTEWATYVAASYAVADKWSVYTWYESYVDRVAPSTAQDVLLGVTYKYDPALVAKVEYLQNIGGRPVNRTGLYASWSILF